MEKISRRELGTSLAAIGFLSALENSAAAQLVTGVSKVQPGMGQLQSKLELNSSNSRLVEVFHWAESGDGLRI